MTQMEKEFIPYQEAFALRELGFDEPCFGWYSEDKKLIRDFVKPQHELEFVLAPTYSQAFRWFREKYGLIGWVEGKRFYRYCIESFIPTDDQLNLSPFPTYEVAELACLKNLIEIIKNKNT